MKILLDEEDGSNRLFVADVLAIVFHEGKCLYAVTAIVDGAPWFGLVHEQSSALREVLE